MIILPLLLTFVACGTQRKAFLFPGQTTSLTFGRGGGVTGGVEEYLIDTSGKVVFRETLKQEPSYREVKTLDRKQLNEIAEKIDALEFLEVTFNHPGNLYWFIETRSDAGPHRVSWGDHRKEAPPEMVELYKYLEKAVTEEP